MRACAANGIPMLEANKKPDTLPSASWREREGSYVSVSLKVCQGQITICESPNSNLMRPFLALRRATWRSLEYFFSTLC